MGRYALRRLLMLVPTLVGMSVLIFLMLRLLPGDVVDLVAGADPSSGSAAREQLREAMGLADPIPVQYLRWLGGIIQGDPGTSIRSGQPVGELLLRSLPITVELAVLATLIATLVAIPLGVLSAVKRDTGWDFAARVGGLIGLSLPSFWIATLALLFTSKVFGWVPPTRYVSPFADPAGNLRQMILPAFALAVQLMAIEMRLTRTTMLEVLNQDYIRTARAKGLRERPVVYRHALRNALIPVVTVVGFQLGALMGTSAIVEVIFGLNGVGYTLLQAIFNRDYPLVQAATLYLATIFVLINLAVDIGYAFLDPRIEQA
ncbi:MAG: Dipeptide transport system permease protein DppB [uncultured Thermomicrobiales bacterium]|uniref:Dipeptide transport system permease protein DppB n=1 Tax=uncultured Thermomicrobiales bacterium TaxID=1645740 RepID=A0A6J4U1T2_9BACT|nr:MAG: Dipeptide transport system permease protein DppB [uncultured Thermomicrobiales bacterium]